MALEEPPRPADARLLIRQILADGEVRFSRHAYDSMDERGMTEVGCTNVLRGGVVDVPPARLLGAPRQAPRGAAPARSGYLIGALVVTPDAVGGPA